MGSASGHLRIKGALPQQDTRAPHRRFSLSAPASRSQHRVPDQTEQLVNWRDPAHSALISHTRAWPFVCTIAKQSRFARTSVSAAPHTTEVLTAIQPVLDRQAKDA